MFKLPLVSRRKYNDLITLCFREQFRLQNSNDMVEMLRSDVDFWKRNYLVYKERSERLEQKIKPRAANGRFVQITEVVK